MGYDRWQDWKRERVDFGGKDFRQLFWTFFLYILEATFHRGEMKLWLDVLLCDIPLAPTKAWHERLSPSRLTQRI